MPYRVRGGIIRSISYFEAIEHATKAAEVNGKPYWVYLDEYCEWHYQGMDPGMAPPYWVVSKTGEVEFITCYGGYRTI